MCSSSPIAFVGALPPTKSGVAVYNKLCLDGYVGQAPLDVYAEVLRRDRLDDVRRWRVWPGSRLSTDIRPGMPLVSVLGNNAFHVRAYEAVLRYGGVAWFHDTSLAGLHHQRALSICDPVQVREYAERVVSANYPGGSQGGVEDPMLLWSWCQHGRRYTGEVTESASGVVVHSQRALDLLRVEAVVPPSLLVPLPVPDLRAPGRRVAGRVVSLGALNPSKLPEVVIGAFALLDAGTSLHWGGGSTGGFSELRARRLAEQLGVSSRFVHTGPLSDAAYLDELQQGSVAVQLRSMADWNGEASGPICEAVGAGVPVVTNLPVSNAEMEAAVIRVSEQPSADEVAAAICRGLDGDYDVAAHSHFADTHRASDVMAAVVRFVEEHGRVR